MRGKSIAGVIVFSRRLLCGDALSGVLAAMGAVGNPVIRIFGAFSMHPHRLVFDITASEVRSVRLNVLMYPPCFEG